MITESVKSTFTTRAEVQNLEKSSIKKKLRTSQISYSVNNKRKKCAFYIRNNDRKTQIRRDSCQMPYIV